MKALKYLFAVIAVVAVSLPVSATLPSVKVTDLKGRVVDTATLNNGGRPMVIAFFDGRCQPCLRELNAINDDYDNWREETGMKLIAISIDEADKTMQVRKIVNENDWDYEILLDPNGDFKRSLGIQNIPHILILDGNGRIVQSRSGYTEGAEAQVIQKIRELK